MQPGQYEKSTKKMRKLNLFLVACLAMILVPIVVSAQAIYYIDPTQSPGLGTEQSPFNSFSQVSWVPGDQYLLKNGTTLSITSPIAIGNSNISIGTYDVGLNPIIQCSSPTSIIDIVNVSDISINGIELRGNHPDITEVGINIVGSSVADVTNTAISNCIIKDVKTGIGTEYSIGLSMNRCDIESFFRNVDLNYSDEIIIENSDFLLLDNYAVIGDKYGIRANYCEKFDIRHNTLRASEPVVCHLFYAEMVSGGYSKFYNNYCIGTEFTVSCAKLGTSLTVLYNNWFGEAQNGILGIDGAEISCDVHHNVFFNCLDNGLRFPVNTPNGGYIANMRHNVIYNSLQNPNYIALNCGAMLSPFSSIMFQNNIVYHTKGKVYKLPDNTGFSNINFNRIPADSPGFIEFGTFPVNTLIDWQNAAPGHDQQTEACQSSPSSAPGTNPFISVNPTSWIDFTPLPESNCIDVGMELTSPLNTNYQLDYFGHFIPSGIPPTGMTGVDIGAIEYYEPAIIDFSSNSPSGWYYATQDILDADHENLNYIHNKGNIYHNGELTYLRGVNLWGIIGSETLNLSNHGIDDILKNIKKFGYNTIRLCYPVDVILQEMEGVSAPIHGYFVNESLSGNSIFFSSPGVVKSRMEGIEAIIDRCNDTDIGLNVVLSHHGMQPPYPYQDPGIWNISVSSSYTVTENDYYESLFYMPTHFTQDNIIGISLINEPFAARWDGSGNSTDFRRFVHTASYNIRAINPDWMIFVEGVKESGSKEIEAEEASSFSYNSASLGTINNPSESYGKAENLSAYGSNSNFPNKPYYPVNENELPYHKLVFSPHTTQFEEYYVIDNISNNSAYVKEVNDYKWGYLSENHAVVPGKFSAIYQSENPGTTFVNQAAFSEEWFKFYVKYMAEKKLPGSFYWNFHGNNLGCVVDNSSVEHCYNQSLVETTDWSQGLADKMKDYAIMFGQVEMEIDPSDVNTMYSPRDGTSYVFPANCFSSNVSIKHTAHWAGEDYLTPSSPDYVEYASDVIAAKALLGLKASILHEFKIICKDSGGNSIGTSNSNFVITIQYTDNELGWVNEHFLNFYKYNQISGNWIEANGTTGFNLNNNSATLVTNEFGIYALAGLGYTATQTINLLNGWSLISTNVNPNFPDVEEMFDGLPIYILKNGAGQMFWPLAQVNSIGDWNYLEGYNVKMNANADLLVEGLRLYPENESIHIPAGWSYIPYLRTTSLLMYDLIPPVSPLYLQMDLSGQDIIKNTAGDLYWPPFQIHNIGNMNPGEGYQIHLTDPYSLVYPANAIGTKNSSIELDAKVKEYKYYQQEIYRNTDNNMVVGIPQNAWSVLPQIGDEIAAFGESGQIVGKTIYQGGFTALVIYGDDHYTPEIMENLADGEDFVFEVWSINKQTTQRHKFSKWEKGNGSFVKNGIDIVKVYEPNPSKFTTNYTVYPNPGNGLFHISITSETSTIFTIQVSDLAGKIVYTNTIHSSEGIQQMEVDLSDLTPGTYLLNLSNPDGYSKPEKLIIQ